MARGGNEASISKYSARQLCDIRRVFKGDCSVDCRAEDVGRRPSWVYMSMFILGAYRIMEIVVKSRREEV